MFLVETHSAALRTDLVGKEACFVSALRLRLDRFERREKRRIPHATRSRTTMTPPPPPEEPFPDVWASGTEGTGACAGSCTGEDCGAALGVAGAWMAGAATVGAGAGTTCGTLVRAASVGAEGGGIGAISTGAVEAISAVGTQNDPGFPIVPR